MAVMVSYRIRLVQVEQGQEVHCNCCCSHRCIAAAAAAAGSTGLRAADMLEAVPKAGGNCHTVLVVAHSCCCCIRLVVDHNSYRLHLHLHRLGSMLVRSLL